MRVIETVKRGCGMPVLGGFYLSATGSPFGALAKWTWLLGDGIAGGANVYLKPPPRIHTLFNLPYTLQTLQHQTESVANVNLDPPLHRLKQLAILDHVGFNHYNPYEFASEIDKLLPSRRITRGLAEKIAPLCPIPIVFTHEMIPVFRNVQDMTAVFEYCLDFVCRTTTHDLDPRAYLFAPTWKQGNFGLGAKDYHGENHYLVYILWAIELMGGVHCLPDVIEWNSVKVGTFSGDVQWVEQPFGVSWITRVQYISRLTDGPDVIERIRKSGIEPVQLSVDDSIDLDGVEGEQDE